MSRNPNWTHDELVLALDAYRRLNFGLHSGRFGEQSPEILELSAALNQLRAAEPANEFFRNGNGVYMKLCNFLRLDPEYGGVGLDAGSKLDEVVWNEFTGREAALKTLASALRRNLFDEAPGAPDIEDLDAEEGRLLLRRHLARERSQKLRSLKVKWAMTTLGGLPCAVCEMTFKQRYGAIGDGYIEIHHLVPLTNLDPGTKTRLSDLALVCSNCHRMLHRANGPATPEQLRTMMTPERPT